MGHKCKEVDDNSFEDDCPYLMAAYILAGLAMMLNIRLCYSSAPYALIRFRLPENLFSVFVRRMASALELWCLPSMLLGNIIDIAQKSTAGTKANYTWVESTFENKLTGTGDETNLINNKRQKFNWIIVPSMVTMWSDFITYVVLLIVYVTGSDHGHVTAYYGVIAISGFIFGINMTLLYAADWRYIPVYMVGENSFPTVTSLMHYITTLMFGNRRKWNSDFVIVTIDICVAIMISFTTAIVWTCAHKVDPDGESSATNIKTPGIDTNSTGRQTSATKFSSLTTNKGPDAQYYWHIMPSDKYDPGDTPHWQIISPALMVIVGMGLVYAIYPGIAPGMIVPFYLVDKIEMVLLIATIFPPIIVATLIKVKATQKYSPKSANQYETPKETRKTKPFGGWRHYHLTNAVKDSTDEANVDNRFWHFFDIMIIIKISLAIIFIYSLHYRDSGLSRSIINQPKMSTALSIIFYMCHEILLALGFPGMIGNNGFTYVMLPIQYIGALFMIFLAFYSGYITEYKGHNPLHLPTERMWYLYGYYQLNPDFFYYDKV